MSLSYYGSLLTYGTRIDAFRRSIEATVREGDRVLDLGTGIGTFAFFAAGAGAGRVWAVDSDPAIHVARSVARVNGMDERIEFVRGRVPGVELPGPFDVIVYEDFPARGLSDRTFRLLRRIREELLAPEGRIVPRSMRFHLAPLRSSRLRSWLFPLDPLEGSGDEEGGAGFDWSPARPYLANQPRTAFLPRDTLAGEPRAGAPISLDPPPAAEELGVAGGWSPDEAGPVHALLLWFDLEVGEGDWISNAPGPDTQPWGQIVLPLDPPVPVGAGGRLEAGVRREAFPDGAPGWLVWHASSDGGEAGGHEFAAYPAALEDLVPDARGAADSRKD